MRGCIARSIVTNLRLEALENAAATDIQSCFRGFRDFVRYVITQFFIIKVQSRSRIYLARRQLKQLMQEDRDEKNRSEMYPMKTIPKTSSFHIIKCQRDAALESSSSHSSFSRRCQQVRMQNGGETQHQQETRAAKVIQRFFIKIKAEIEMEILRMKQKAAKKKKLQRGSNGTGRQILSSSGSNHSYNSSSFGHVRETPPSREQASSIYTSHSTGNEGSIAYRMKNEIPRIITDQRIDSSRQYVFSQASASNPSPARGWAPSVKSAVQQSHETTYRHQTDLLPLKRMPSMQYIAQQDGYDTHVSFNQAYVPPPSFGVSYPYHHPSPSQSSNRQYPPICHAHYGAQYSQPEQKQWHNPLNSTSNHSRMLHPGPSSHHGHHPQHLMNNPPLSNTHQRVASPVLSHYPELQRHPGQTPATPNVHYNMRKYQQNARY